ncbi:Alpha/Beta hydrolase protein [Jimgerdemannia flammicorona]|uniref:Alpha/Beta hydrolase protein n=1 Tax=Jimgerdemannia flammicorona TaxID=994334 RepID=A0A433QRS4_9FUNG|nr:Alpha/Beta hydrolase protein [Jimgerdemannia flammicorona]
MSLFVRSLAIATALIAVLYAVIPDARKPLGSLRTVENDASLPYPPTFYPGGHDLTLPGGTMRYYIFGPSTGQKVVFVHGLTIPSPIWSNIATNLTDDNTQVLLYDIWGRGYSDSPGTRFDEHLYISQLAQLLQKVGWDREPFTLVGLSMGGAIATSFTRFYPELVKQLVLIAPAGLMTKTDFPVVGHIVSTPFFSQLATSSFVRPLVVRGARGHLPTDHPDISHYDDQKIHDAVKLTREIVISQILHHPGFFRAFIGTTTDFPLFGLDERYQRVGEDPKRPVLVFWGDRDSTVPYKYSATLKEYVSHAEIVTIERGGHGIAITNYKMINERLRAFLKDDESHSCDMTSPTFGPYMHQPPVLVPQTMNEVDTSLSALDSRLRHLEQLLGTAKGTATAKDALLQRVDAVRRHLSTTLRDRKYILDLLEKYDVHAKTLDPAVSALAIEREILSPEAKVEIVIAAEAELTQFSDDLKQIKALEGVVSGVELQGEADCGGGCLGGLGGPCRRED